MKKKHTILIVPPRGVPLKSFRIRLPVAIVIIVIALAGFAGFFVPIHTVTNNVAEQNQRKNLSEQNRALLQKIISSLRMLQNVRNQVARLENKKENVIKVSGSQQRNKDTAIDTIDFSQVKSRELFGYIAVIEKQFGQFGIVEKDSNNIFDTLPVLYPLPVPCIISRKYGKAYDPFSGLQRTHFGTDFIAASGTDVYSTASGIVRKVEKHTLWGNKVAIEHSGSYSTVYAHLGTVSVTVGKKVRRGEVIGQIGLSGLSSGPHVHYEIIRNGVQVDPEEYLFPLELLAGR